MTEPPYNFRIWQNNGPPAINASNLNELELNISANREHRLSTGNVHQTTFSQLLGVNITNPTANQILSYNGSLWVNADNRIGYNESSGLFTLSSGLSISGPLSTTPSLTITGGVPRIYLNKTATGTELPGITWQDNDLNKFGIYYEPTENAFKLWSYQGGAGPKFVIDSNGDLYFFGNVYFCSANTDIGGVNIWFSTEEPPSSDYIWYYPSGSGTGKIVYIRAYDSETSTWVTTSSFIPNGSITGDKIAAGAISGTHISASTISGIHIKASSITGTHIVANAISGSHISANSITSSKISSDSITSTHLSANAVTVWKLNLPEFLVVDRPTISSPSSGWISWNNFSFKYGDYAYQVYAGSTNKKYVYIRYTESPFHVATDEPIYSAGYHLAIINKGSGGEFVLDTIGTVIDGFGIKTSSIDASHIMAGAIQASHITVSAIQASHIAVSAVDASNIKAGAIQAIHVSTNTIITHSANISDAVIQRAHIASGAIDTARIADEISSPDYQSGVRGWKITKQGFAEFQNVFVRGAIETIELRKQTVSAIGGTFVISPYTTILHSNVAASDTTIWVRDNITGANGTYFLLQTGENNIEYIKLGSFVASASVSGFGYIYKYNVSRGQLGSTPKNWYEGTAMAQWNNRIVLTSSFPASPYIDVLEGSGNDAVCRVRLGCLSGVTDEIFGTLSGWGLYAQNVYLRGKIQIAGIAPSSSVINTSVLTEGSPASGLNLTASYLGFFDGSNWKVYFKNDGTFRFSGNSDNYIDWNNSVLTVRGLINIIGSSLIDTVYASCVAGWAHPSDSTKLDGTDIYPSTITSTVIAPGSIITGHLSANCVTSDKISAGSISANHLAANCITAEKISAGAVQTSHIRFDRLSSDPSPLEPGMMWWISSTTDFPNGALMFCPSGTKVAVIKDFTDNVGLRLRPITLVSGNSTSERAGIYMLLDSSTFISGAKNFAFMARCVPSTIPNLGSNKSFGIIYAFAGATNPPPSDNFTYYGFYNYATFPSPSSGYSSYIFGIYNEIAPNSLGAAGKAVGIYIKMTPVTAALSQTYGLIIDNNSPSVCAISINSGWSYFPIISGSSLNTSSLQAYGTGTAISVPSGGISCQFVSATSGYIPTMNCSALVSASKVQASILQAGDIIFKNNWRIVEDDSGLLLVSPEGKRYRFVLEQT